MGQESSVVTSMAIPPSEVLLKLIPTQEWIQRMVIRRLRALAVIFERYSTTNLNSAG